MYFVDTNILLQNLDFLKDKVFAISDITLRELENIKTSRTKSEDVKYSARKAVNWLINNLNKYEVYCFDKRCADDIEKYGLPITPDAQIIATCPSDYIFLTNDLCCYLIAKNIFGLKVETLFDKDKSDYKGYAEIKMSDEEMAHFYEHMNENPYGILNNEYAILKNSSDEIVDVYRWNGESFQPIYRKQLKTVYFDKLKAKDVYQSCVIDSLMTNTITAISGKAGSGKSLLSLMSAMSLIEAGKYDKIVVLFNPTKTRGASDMGFYGGDFLQKAMDNSIGQILTTKFGDRYAVDLLLQQNKLKLVSMADCRGMEISDNEILWITEAQNTSIDLIKLCLSRVSSGAKVIIEGDYESQTDSVFFEGNNNGLRRVIEVFKNHPEFGYVQLKNVWRSKIAELCELL